MSSVVDLLTSFQVEGPLNTGVVNLHMVKRPGQDGFEYKYLALDVKGTCRPCSFLMDFANRKKGIRGYTWRTPMQS